MNRFRCVRRGVASLTLPVLFVGVVLLGLSGLVVPQQVGAEEADNNNDEEALNQYLDISYGLYGTYEKRNTFLDGQYVPKEIYETQRLAVAYRSPLFDFVADGSFNGDMELRGGDEQEYTYDRYFGVQNAYFSFHPDPLTFKMGRYPLLDEVDSPYPLYLSEKENPHLSAEIRYETDRFHFRSSWTELNRDSRHIYTGSDNLWVDDGAGGYDLNPDVAGYYDVEGESVDDPDHSFYPNPPDVDDIPEYDDDGIAWVDRGMNYRTYALTFGDWTFGFQETAIYYNDVFEPEFMLNPVPMFVMQTILDKGGGRPWGRYRDIKSQMGFFGELHRQDYRGYGQLLVDDINANFVEIISGTSQGHQKLAWSLGGERDFSFGTLSFYHAGATKYTFQGTHTFEHTGFNSDEVPLWYSSKPYPYIYYPANVTHKGGDDIPIHYSDNYIGYEYGENNLAFMVDYENRLFRGGPFEIDFYDSFEYVLNGSKSPTDPWHEYQEYKNISGSFHLFEGTVEHILVNTMAGAKSFGNFVLSLNLKTGIVINAIELERDNDVSAYRFVPQSGDTEKIFQITIGGMYAFDKIGM